MLTWHSNQAMGRFTDWKQGQSTMQISSAVCHAITSLVLRFVPHAIAETFATIFGLLTAAMPLLLWVSWSKHVFLSVLVFGSVCTALYAIFAIATAPDEPTSDFIESRRAQKDYEGKRAIKSKSTWRDPG